MTRTQITSAALAFTMAALGGAQQQVSSTSTTAHLTGTQLKQLLHEAHSQAQYETIATYYREEQTTYSQEAAQEKQEWIRRGQNVMVVAAKYPRPVDSARYLYEYYADQARHAEQLAKKYEQLAASATSAISK
jgi:hypothetical protein